LKKTVNIIFALLAVAWSAPAADGPRRDAVVRAVEKVMPAVVNIRTETVMEIRDPFSEVFRDFWNPFHTQPRRDVRQSLGSGVIIDPEGYLLTNDHVVRRATRIQVRLSDGRELEAERVAYNQRADLALLKLKAKPGTRFKTVPFARDDDLLLGETVLALGNPFGLGGSVSRGILSSKARRAPQANAALDVANWLQTDAAINPGNSGGPLVNLDGELIGINVAIHRQGQGLGFSIPIKRVNEALGEFFTPEYLRGLWLGARVRVDGDRLRLAAVEPGSPAATAGLTAGDTVLEVNGKAVAGFVSWARAITAGGAGGKMKARIRIFRGGRAHTVTVTMQPEEKVFNAKLIEQRLGLTVRLLTHAVAEQSGLSFFGGYLITAVEADGPGALAQLESGGVIREVNGLTPPNVVAFARMMRELKRGEAVRLGVTWEVRRGAFLQRRSGVATLKAR
jgi:S1-C subfamily serine protease